MREIIIEMFLHLYEYMWSNKITICKIPLLKVKNENPQKLISYAYARLLHSIPNTLMKVGRLLTISMAGAKERFVWKQQHFFQTTVVNWSTSFIPCGSLFSIIPSFMRTIYVKLFIYTAYYAKISGSVVSWRPTWAGSSRSGWPSVVITLTNGCWLSFLHVSKTCFVWCGRYCYSDSSKTPQWFDRYYSIGLGFYSSYYYFYPGAAYDCPGAAPIAIYIQTLNL